MIGSSLINKLSRSRWRVPLLRFLLRFDNRLRALITLFALERGVHPKHRITRYHDFFVNHLTSQDRVLDVGCGRGYLAADMAKKARQVIGIDIDQPSIDFAQQHFHQSNLSYLVGDATTYPLQEHVDVLVLSNVLEHIENRQAFLKRLSPYTKKFLIRVPLLTRDWVAVLKKELGVEYRLDPTHFTEFTDEQFRAEMHAAGLHIEALSTCFGELYSVLRPLPNNR